MKYQAVFFDLDGTLLDSVPTILSCTKNVCAAMNLHYDEIVFRRAIGVPLEVQAQQFAGDRAEEYVSLYRRNYMKYYGQDFNLFPGTYDMLEALNSNGNNVGLVTSKSMRSTTRALEATDIRDLFEVVVTADDVENFKPHPEPLQKALNALQVAHSDALYVGDSAFDIDMAQRAGVDVVAVSWGARSRDDMLLLCPQEVFDSWNQFLAWLRN